MELGASKNPHSVRTFGPFGPDLPTPWLVLGGGGLKGLAHIGAWQAICEARIRPCGIVGTSIGALVGVLAAAGKTPTELREEALALERGDIVRINRRAVWINGVRQLSVFHGETLHDYIESLLPGVGWDSLGIPVLMNAVDLADGQTEWFGPGARTDVSLVDAVYASSALPVFYPPLQHDGHAYVDGGINRTLALGRAAEAGAQTIIAVDVGSSGSVDLNEVMSGGLISVHQRVVGIMTSARRHDIVSEWEGAPLLYVRPRLEGYGTFDFEHVPYFLDEGYRATREALVAGG